MKQLSYIGVVLFSALHASAAPRGEPAPMGGGDPFFSGDAWGDEILDLASAQEVVIPIGERRIAQLPVGASAYSLDPDVVQIFVRGDRVVLEAVSLGMAFIMLEQSGDTRAIRVEVSMMGLPTQRARANEQNYAMQGFQGGGELGERGWMLDTMQTFGTGGVWSNNSLGYWRDAIGDATQDARLHLVSSPDNVRVAHLQSLTEAENWRLQMGDQLIAPGIMIPMFGVRPTVRVHQGLSVQGALGTRRLPLGPMPRWGDPMIATTGVHYEHERFWATTEAGATVADNDIAPTGSGGIGYTGDNAGFRLAGGQIGESRQAIGHGYLRTGNFSMSVGAQHMGGGDPVMAPVRNSSFSNLNTTARYAFSRRLVVGAQGMAALQDGEDLLSRRQMMAGGYVTLMPTDRLSLTANSMRFFPAGAEPGRWTSGLGGTLRSPNLMTESFVSVGGVQAPDLLIWRNNVRWMGRGPYHLTGIGTVFARRDRFDLWKIRSQIGAGLSRETRNLMLGLRALIFTSENEVAPFVAASASYRPFQFLRLNTQLLTNGRQSTSVWLGMTLTGRPIVKVGGRALGLSSTLEGVAYRDINLNGVRDEGEPGIEGLELSVDKKRKATTDASGFYQFPGLAEGDRRVQIDSGEWLPSGPSEVVVSTKPLLKKTVDFPLRASSIVAGTVYFDANRNHQFDPDETLAPEVLVTLMNPSGERVATSYSGQGFVFKGLEPGIYSLLLDPSTLPPSVRVPGGLELSGEVGLNDSRRFDIALHSISTVSGQLWVNGQPPTSQVNIHLRKWDGALVASTQSRESGGFAFRGVDERGWYEVVLDDGTTSDPFLLNGEKMAAKIELSIDKQPRTDVVELMSEVRTLEMVVGGVGHVPVYVAYADGSFADVSDKIRWTAADDSVVAVHAGALVGLSVGGTELIGELIGHEIAIQADVTMPALQSIVSTLPPDVQTMLVGQNQQARAWGIDKERRLHAVNVDRWLSSNEEVVRVNEGGTLSALGDGVAIIWPEVNGGPGAPIQIAVQGDRTRASRPGHLSGDIEEPSPRAVLLDPAQLSLQREEWVRPVMGALYNDGSVLAVHEGMSWDLESASSLDNMGGGWLRAREVGAGEVRARYRGVRTRPVPLIVTERTSRPLFFEIDGELVSGSQITLPIRSARTLRVISISPTGQIVEIPSTIQISEPETARIASGKVDLVRPGWTVITAQSDGFENVTLMITGRP